MPSPLRLLIAVAGALACCLLCAGGALADEVQANQQGTVRPSAPDDRAVPERRTIDSPSRPETHYDPAVEPATFHRAGPAADTTQSAPQTGRLPLPKKGEPRAISPSGSKGQGKSKAPGSSSGSLLTVAMGLVVVLGLFFLVAWLMRRGVPTKGGQLLPTDVLEVLGRMPLPGRQQLQLLRFGNKLLLVSLAPGVAETLAEISDPTEIDRLTGLCQQGRSGSATAVFRNMLQQLSSDRKSTKPAAKSPETSGGAPSVREMLEEHDV